MEAAQASGTIVRSWPMRGTLHFVAAEDLGWMLELTAERIIRSAAGRHRQLELADADFERAAAIARERLTGGTHLDRRELLAAFEEGGVSTAGQRGVHMLGKLAQLRITVLCSQSEWALYDEWIPNPRRLERDDALAEFAFRYFAARGPATIRDFSWWSSLTLTDARRGLDLARDQLDEVEVDGVSHYLRPGLEPAKAAVHLLPGFDEYLLGYSDPVGTARRRRRRHHRARRQRRVLADDRRERRGGRILATGDQGREDHAHPAAVPRAHGNRGVRHREGGPALRALPRARPSTWPTETRRASRPAPGRRRCS